MHPATPAGRSRARLLSFLQAAISAGLLAWIFWDPRVRADAAVLVSAADWRWLAVGVAVAGVGFGAGILRWILVLRLLDVAVPARRAAVIQAIGGFFDLFLLGAAGGDSMKVLLVVREVSGTVVRAIQAVIFDHLAGVFALAAAVVLFTLPHVEILQSHFDASAIVGFLLLYLAACAGAVVLTAVIAVFPPPAWVRRRPFFQKHGHEVHLGCRRIFTHPHLSLGAVGCSFVSWASHMGAFFCGAMAVGANPTSRGLLAVIPASEALSTLPVTISGLGLREKSFAVLLRALEGIPAGTAVLISLAGFACIAAWSLPGAFLFGFGGLSHIPRRTPRNSAV